MSSTLTGWETFAARPRFVRHCRLQADMNASHAAHISAASLTMISSIGKGQRAAAGGACCHFKLPFYQCKVTSRHAGLQVLDGIKEGRVLQGGICASPNAFPAS